MNPRLLVMLVSLVVWGWTPSVFAVAIGQPLEFDDQAQERQYQKLVKELRCTVCQSESVYESNAALAADVRRRVYEMTLAGASEQEIIDFMVTRYGNYVRYRPPLQKDTLLLWSSPFLLLLVGGLIWWQVVHRRRQFMEPPALSSADLKVLAALKEKHTSGGGV